MALFGDDQGKTEKPTPGRLQEARRRGDTHLSRELVTGALLLASAILLRTFGDWLLDGLGAAMRHGLTVDLRERPIAAASVPAACRELFGTLQLVAAPAIVMLLLLLLVAAVAGYAQIGVRWSDDVLAPKLERLNPAANWKRLLSMQAVMRTVFAIGKLLLLVAVTWLVVRGKWSQLFVLADQDFPTATRVVADLALSVLLWVAVLVFLLALADVFWQRRDFEQRNMMTKQEVEDERRRSEGDPLVKSRLQKARAELMRHRMMAAVPKATVIVTNPTHYAVALRYERHKHRAPEVVAKGTDEVAARIRELAKEHGVPLLEDPPLARALFAAVKVGQEIPARFYEAVATVLSHVFKLKNRVA